MEYYLAGKNSDHISRKQSHDRLPGPLSLQTYALSSVTVPETEVQDLHYRCISWG